MEFKTKAADSQIIDLSDKGIVTVYINKFNVIDASGDLSLPGSFKKTFSERLKKMWWLLNHEWEQSLGVTMELKEDAIGAIAVGKFNLDKQIAKDTYSDYKFFAENDRTLQHSVRVSPVKFQIEKDVTIVSEWAMREWSTLTRPGAIEDTPLISIKQAPDEIAALKKALGYNYSDEKLKAIEEKIKSLETLINQAGKSTFENKPISDDIIKKTIHSINNLKF
jgi:HK97 family phage prohead protease